MSFCIMRMEKIKDNRGVVMSLQHNTRDRMPINADPELTKNNQYVGGRTLECMARYDELLPENVRKNAVRAVEIVMTASPDYNGDWNKYLKACDNWALQTFGIDPNKEDIRPAIHLAHHFDEKTPHTHILITPLKDGKLNARHFIGGHRDHMAELQEDFYQKVGKEFGLERGQPKQDTRARHTHHNLSDLDQKEKELIKKLSDIEQYHKEQAELAKKRIAELDARENQLKKDQQDFKNVQGINVRAMTPDGLRGFATTIEAKGCRSVSEYVNKRHQEMEVEQRQEQQQGIRR